jgi:hypothetical protein
MKAKFLLILFSCLCLNISHAQWVPIVQNIQDDVVYYDPSRIVQNGDFLHVRIYSNFSNPRPGDISASRSSMTHLAINCQKKTFFVPQIIDFDGINLQGASRPKNFPFPKISAIPEKSSVQEIGKKVCD